MRNRISIIIALVFIIALVGASCYGIKIGNFKVLSISQLIEKNEQLDMAIKGVNNLTSVEYPDNVSQLKESFQFYLIEKEKYNDLIATTSGVDEEVYETKQYDIGYLWKRLGSYVKEEKFSGDPGLEISLDVQKNKVGPTTYDFNFEVRGSYTRISQFIVDIENDSELNFRIQNFRMTNGVAAFTVKNVNIDESTINLNAVKK